MLEFGVRCQLKRQLQSLRVLAHLTVFSIQQLIHNDIYHITSVGRRQFMHVPRISVQPYGRNNIFCPAFAEVSLWCIALVICLVFCRDFALVHNSRPPSLPCLAVTSHKHPFVLFFAGILRWCRTLVRPPSLVSRSPACRI